MCPNDPDTIKKLKECEKAIMKLKFEEAIAISVPQRDAVVNPIDFHTVGIIFIPIFFSLFCNASEFLSLLTI